MALKIKICGITDPAAMEACLDYGADYAGFVFVCRSSRAIEKDKAATLLQIANGQIDCVGLFADPSDSDLAFILDDVSLGMIQLHGHESPERVAEIRARFGLPVIKALPVAEKSDLYHYKSYIKDTEYILYDTKTKDGFGGTGQVFDWSWLAEFSPPMRWGLAGGLHAGNARKALSICHPALVDVSGGVRSAAGVKDPVKIKEFIETVRKSG